MHGEFKEKIYIKQHQGFEIERKEDYICLLKKSLYGLNQSQKQWHKRLDSFMLVIVIQGARMIVVSTFGS